MDYDRYSATRSNGSNFLEGQINSSNYIGDKFDKGEPRTDIYYNNPKFIGDRLRSEQLVKLNWRQITIAVPRLGVMDHFFHKP